MTLTREQVEDLLNSLEERIAIPVFGYLNAQQAEIERLCTFDAAKAALEAAHDYLNDGGTFMWSDVNALIEAVLKQMEEVT